VGLRAWVVSFLILFAGLSCAESFRGWRTVSRNRAATVAGPGPQTATPESDFQARCAAPGVLRCVGWDNPSDFAPASGGGGLADGLYAAGSDGSYQGTMDATIKTSGAGALKFTIRPGSVIPHSSSPAGYWRSNFGPLPNLTKFGAHSTLYLQFRVRVDEPMLNFHWPSVGGQGWKVFIAFGPVPGPSCTNTQFVQENTNQSNVLTGYTSCGSPALYTNNGNPPMLIEQGEYKCAYNSGGQAHYATDHGCFKYVANTWITEYWVVQIGELGQPNSHFQAWAALPGQALKRFIDLPSFTFSSAAAGTAGEGLQEILLTPYFSGATGSTTTPGATMWFDELIISRQAIAAPKF
jgi:hypothetical protein